MCLSDAPLTYISVVMCRCGCVFGLFSELRVCVRECVSVCLSESVCV